MKLAHTAVRVRYRMPIHSENHVARSQARIFCRAARAHRFNRRALHLLRHVVLLAHIGSQVSHRQSKPAFLLRSLPVVAACLGRSLWNSPTVTCSVSGLPSRRMPSSIAVPGRHLAHRDLQHAAVRDLLAVELAQHVAALQGRRGSPASPASPGSRLRRLHQAD